MANEQRPTNIREVATIAVPVADPERALAFYAGTLGLEVRRDVPFGPGARWIEVAPSEATTTIALAPHGGGPVGVDTGIRLASGDCEADHRALRGAGVAVGDILRWPGVPPMFSLRDPDGNTLYVVELQAG
jgi:catechol 2,3-dioxygenase-like lactoylglutathione lyase family enzyme